MQDKKVHIFSLKYLILIIFTIIHFVPIEVVASDETQRIKIIKYLYEEEYYFRAISEAIRFIFDYPNSPYTVEIKILVAESYMNGGDEETTLHHFLKFIDEHPDSPKVTQVNFKIGKLYSKNIDYVTAEKYFKKILSNKESSKALIIKAKEWIVLLSLLKDVGKNNIQQTINEFGLSNDQELLKMVEEYRYLNFKSPKIAGTLSAILPDAGQLYIIYTIQNAKVIVQ